MLGFLKTHPYLVANIPLLVTIVVVGTCARPRRFAQTFVPAGLLCIPSALIAFTFEGDYWAPDRLGGLMIGIEDVIFSFNAGALAWLLAAWPFRRRIRATVEMKAAMTRFASLSLIGGIVIIGSHLWGNHSMVGFAAASLVVLSVILALGPKRWVLAVTGGLLFTTAHTLLVRIQFWIWPDYVTFWNREGLLGTSFVGVPLIEPLWALFFGSVWPVIVGFVFDVRFDRFHSPPTTETIS